MGGACHSDVEIFEIIRLSQHHGDNRAICATVTSSARARADRWRLLAMSLAGLGGAAGTGTRPTNSKPLGREWWVRRSQAAIVSSIGGQDRPRLSATALLTTWPR